jgi:hydrogenase expression/formation protein HypC
MCLGVPGRITAIYEEDGMRMGSVDFGGVSRPCCLEFTPEAQAGDFVLIHVGFAISLMDESEAARTIAMLRGIADAGDAPGPEPLVDGEP